MRFRASFGVAVGQPIYPTPIGKFTIVTKQRNPWWYPAGHGLGRRREPDPARPGQPARHSLDGPLGLGSRHPRDS